MKLTLARQAAQALARSRLYAAEPDAAGADVVPGGGERSARFLSRLQPTLGQVAQLRSPARRLVRDRHRRADGRDRAARGGARGSRESALGLQLQDATRPTRTPPTGVPQVLRTGEPEFFPSIPEEVLDQAIGDDLALRRIMDELGLRSTICVPLIARGRTLGAVILIAAETHPSYTQADLEQALELARRAAVAVDNARLYREAERGADAARALAYVRRRRPARHQRPRTPLEPGRRAITGVDRARARSAAWSGTSSLLGGAHLARAAGGAGRGGAGR